MSAGLAGVSGGGGSSSLRSQGVAGGVEEGVLLEGWRRGCCWRGEEGVLLE